MSYPEDFDEDFCQCPRCSGWGEADCNCGGDLCVCTNYGRQDCPMCFGEGEVSIDDANIYFQKQAENHAAMKAAWDKVEAERDNSNPTEDTHGP